MSQLLPLFIVGFLLLFHHTHSTNLQILRDVKTSFIQDPKNVLCNWSDKNPSYCNWTGVTCARKFSQMVGLNLSGASFIGSISPSISLLRNLIHLDLSSNQLSGPI
ncbi:putative non-specific serine/threonine protein kinase [Helianthus debilis subsp. tardiflorus]